MKNAKKYLPLAAIFALLQTSLAAQKPNFLSSEKMMPAATSSVPESLFSTSLSLFLWLVGVLGIAFLGCLVSAIFSDFQKIKTLRAAQKPVSLLR